MTKSQIFSKKQTQRVLKDLKHEGYTVKKESGMYSVYVSNLLGDKRVFVAMPGTRGYLVRYDEELLTPAN